MGEATGPLPAITGTSALLYVSEQVIAELRRTQDLIRRDIAARGPLTELVMTSTRLAEMECAWRKGTMLELTRDPLEAPALAAVPAPRSHRRRAREPFPGQGKLWPVPGVAALGAFLHRLAGHGLAGKALAVHVAKVTAVGVTAATAATGLTVAAVHVIAAPASPSQAFAGVPAPAASASAAPFTAPATITWVTRPKAGTDAHGASRELSAPGFAPPYAPPSASQPSVTPPSAQPAQQQGPSEGRLSIPAASSPVTVSDVTQPFMIELDASAAGNVTWGLLCTDTGGPAGCGDITFSAVNGSIQAGQSAYVSLTFDANAQAEGGTVTLVIGRQQVQVSWLPVPQPAPSPAVTDTPTGFPTDLAPSPAGT